MDRISQPVAPADAPPAPPPGLEAGLAAARQALLDQRAGQGHWEGELCSSALSTATALAALALADATAHAAVIRRALEWLAAHANDDGGWGDSVLSRSNISTTLLCWSAFAAAGADREAAFADVLSRAADWLTRAAGSLEPQRLAGAVYARYGNDRTFSAPILSLCAIAGRLGPGRQGWRYVAQLPFELAVLPHGLFRFLNLRVVSYALPALIAIGLSRHRRRPSLNPLALALRAAARPLVLARLERIQPASGGFLEAAPLTSFVVMNLVAAGCSDSPVVRRGIEFLLAGVRADGSWPIDTNLATWNTTLAVNALSVGRAGPDSPLAQALSPQERASLLEWLQGQQHARQHPFTRAEPGGWAWTDLSGAVPDGDDTPGALLALGNLVAASRRCARPAHVRQGRRLSSHSDGRGLDRHVLDSARMGLRWLCDLQNRDGGIPTFCRGWGKLPFDRSSNDLTAHALLAMDAWIDELDPQDDDAALPPAQAGTPAARTPAVKAASPQARYRPAGADDAGAGPEGDSTSAPSGPAGPARDPNSLAGRCERTIRRGAGFLTAEQRLDGAWPPLWFGNQHAPTEENLTYGTARVLISLQRLGRRWNCIDPAVVRRGRDWLLANQNADGGWGGQAATPSSIEETALALDALCSAAPLTDPERSAAARACAWLLEHTRGGTHFPPSPIGFYFAKLWYFEKLYPLLFTVSALAKAGAALRGDPR